RLDVRAARLVEAAAAVDVDADVRAVDGEPVDAAQGGGEARSLQCEPGALVTGDLVGGRRGDGRERERAAGDVEARTVRDADRDAGTGDGQAEGRERCAGDVRRSARRRRCRDVAG